MKRLMLLGCVCIAPWAAGFGCSDDEPSADGVDGSETLAGDGDGDSGDGDGDGDGDSGDGDGDSGDGDGDSGDGDGDSGDGDGDGDSGDGDGDPGNITYDAVAQPGGLDRIVVRRHDPNTNTCTRMVLVSPLDLETFVDVTLPMPWSIESVANHQPADCSVFDAIEWIDFGAGTVEFNGFDMFGVFPCAISVDIVFGVSGDRLTLDFQVMDLDVSGAC
jgi:hypothetical protein